MAFRRPQFALPNFQLHLRYHRPYQAAHETFAVQTSDGVTLRGVHLQRGSDTGVVYCHGFLSGKNFRNVPGFVEALADRFDVAAFDFRGHGDSAGTCTFTRQEILDLDAVVRYMRGFDYRHLIVIGSSMGGATTIRYAAASGAPDGIVTIGAFADYNHFVYPSTALSFRLAFTPPLGSTFTRVTRNTRLGQIRALDGQPREVVSRITAPTLFIHGERDLLVHPKEARLLHELAVPPKELHMVKGAGHDMPLLNRTTAETIFEWADRTVRK